MNNLGLEIEKFVGKCFLEYTFSCEKAIMLFINA